MKELETENGPVSLVEEPVLLSEANAFLELAFSAGSKTLVLKKEHLAASFFDLKSGLAGELLQKVSNYKRRLVILGDFSLESKNVTDFIRESNKYGQIIFAATLEQALEFLI